jgi:hypothetical protein
VFGLTPSIAAAAFVRIALIRWLFINPKDV